MALDYSQKIERVLPVELWTERDCAGLLKGLGLTPNADINRVLLFRDPRTVAALLRCDESLQDVYLRTGGLKPWEDLRLWTGKTDFLREKLRDVIQHDRDGIYRNDTLKAAVGMVIRLGDDLTRGRARDKNGYPVVGDPMARALMREDPLETFDVNAALARAFEQVKEDEALDGPAPSPFGTLFG